MKGLFIKDFRLLLLQKNFLLLVFGAAVGMILFTDDSTFPLGFMCFIVSLFVISTISYDDFDNGSAFLFTLPITRKSYVVEKYLLGLILGCGSWVIATIISIVSVTVKGTMSVTGLMMSAAMILPAVLLIQAVTIPFVLKFGGERGRIALLGAVGSLILLGVIIVKGAKAVFGVDPLEALDAITSAGMGVFIAAAEAISLALLFLSMMTGIYIMKKKEF